MIASGNAHPSARRSASDSKKFPLMDYFTGGDSDLDNYEAAIKAMTKMASMADP